MTESIIWFRSTTIDTCTFPPYYYYILKHINETETTPFENYFELTTRTLGKLSWKLTNGEWIGGEEEEGYNISSEFSLEIITILKSYNYV